MARTTQKKPAPAASPAEIDSLLLIVQVIDKYAETCYFVGRNVLMNLIANREPLAGVEHERIRGLLDRAATGLANYKAAAAA